MKKIENNGMSFEFLEVDDFVKNWETIRPFFIKALSRTDERENNIEEVYRQAVTKESTACVVRKNENIINAFLITRIDYVGAKAAYIYALGGAGLRETLAYLLPDFAEFLKGYGYDWLEFQAEKSIERVYKRYGIVPTTKNMRFYM